MDIMLPSKEKGKDIRKLEYAFVLGRPSLCSTTCRLMEETRPLFSFDITAHVHTYDNMPHLYN
jgi:hypothetical protein